jgi:hypothetical protein
MTIGAGCADGSLRVTWLLMDEDEYAIATTNSRFLPRSTTLRVRNDKQKDKQRQKQKDKQRQKQKDKQRQKQKQPQVPSTSSGQALRLALRASLRITTQNDRDLTGRWVFVRRGTSNPL